MKNLKSTLENQKTTKNKVMEELEFLMNNLDQEGVINEYLERIIKSKQS